MAVGNIWSYEGEHSPSHWSLDFPACNGTRQSPIDIPTNGSSYANKTRWLKFKNYGLPLNGTFINNGHSMQFNPVENGYNLTLKGGFIPKPYKYRFLQLHFHWGQNDSVGSEHTVDGMQYPLEMHLVHKLINDDGSNVNQLAVLGVFFNVTDFDNYLFDPIAKAAELLANGTSEEVQATLVLEDFLQEMFGFEYFSYDGSLTTPGCDETVTWMVMSRPISISESQVILSIFMIYNLK